MSKQAFLYYASLMLITHFLMAPPGQAFAQVHPKQLEELKQERQKLQSEVRNLQETSVDKAGEVQMLERKLHQRETNLRRLRAEKEAAERLVEQGKKRLSKYTYAMLRLSDVPPDALVMLPQLGEEKLQAASALKLMSETMARESAAVEAALKQAKAITKEEEREHRELTESLREETKKKQALDSAIANQQRALKDNRSAIKTLEEKAKAAAKSSKSTKELIGRLETASTPAEKAVKKASKASLKEFTRNSKLRAPIAGRIVKKYGQESPMGDKGVLIESRGGATVTSPFSGEVVFSGPFMNYGRMVIIRHKGDLHSVLAGMDTIYTRTGEILLEGEPIGAMSSVDATSQLYFEVRRGNQNIDPASLL